VYDKLLKPRQSFRITLYIKYPTNLCLRLYLKRIHHYNLMRWTIIWGFPISKLPSIVKYSVTTTYMDACQLERRKAIKAKQDPHCTLQKPAMSISYDCICNFIRHKISTLLVSPSVVWLLKGTGAQLVLSECKKQHDDKEHKTICDVIMFSTLVTFIVHVSVTMNTRIYSEEDYNEYGNLFQ